MKKLFTWYYMFTKRLIHHYSFVIILALIPVLMPIVNNVMSRDNSMLEVALCVRDDNAVAKQIIEKLRKSDSIINYQIYNSENEAEEAVRTQEIDAAWVFAENLDKNLEKYAKGQRTDPMVTIYERETDIRTGLAREKLYGELFPHISYSLYSNFMRTQARNSEKITDKELYRSYSGKSDYENIVVVEELDAGTVNEPKTNHLTAPLRGLFSLIVVLCGLSAAMYFLKDNRDGRFDYMPAQNRIIPAFGLCLSATIICSVAVYIALLVSGLYTGFARETVSIILFALAVTGFCVLISLPFRSPGSFGATMPFFIIVMIALSPIFFNVKMLKPVSYLLPTYYYLHAIYNPGFIFYMAIYNFVIYSLAIVLNKLKTRKG